MVGIEHIVFDPISLFYKIQGTMEYLENGVCARSYELKPKWVIGFIQDGQGSCGIYH